MLNMLYVNCSKVTILYCLFDITKTVVFPSPVTTGDRTTIPCFQLHAL